MRMVIILNSLMLGSIDTVGFKDKGITDVFFVAEHCVDGSFAPFIFAGGRLMPCLSSSLTMPNMLMRKDT